MRKKQLKLKITTTTTQKSSANIIKAQFNDNQFLNYVDRNKIRYPPIITNHYNIQYGVKEIIFTPIRLKIECQAQCIRELRGQLGNFMAVHYRGQCQQEDEKDVQEIIRCFKNSAIYGWKKYYINQGRFQKGDFIFYIKGDDLKDIKQFIEEMNSYMKDEVLLFDVGTLLGLKNLPNKYHKLVADVIVEEKLLNIEKMTENLSLFPMSIQAGSEAGNNFQSKQRPATSIRLKLTGNRQNIHKLYLEMEQKLTRIQMVIVELEEQLTLDEKSQSFVQVLTEFNNKMFKIAPNAVVILNKIIDAQQIEDIKRKLKLQIWNINQQSQQFLKQQIRILDTQHKNRSLKLFMSRKRIFWEDIVFLDDDIRITCDKLTKNKFVEECRNLLKSFVKERENCPNFDSTFLVEVFRKYYQKNLEERYSVNFQFGDNYIIRNNYSKYSEQIQQDLKAVIDKIRKKIVIFLRLQSMKKIPGINLKFFPERQNPAGYEHNLLGCTLYTLGNVRIKMKRLESLKKQQDTIIYLLDDRIEETSIFYEAIKNNKINYQTLLLDVHKSKKPERLRQYLTEDCPYGHKTIVLHAGREKVTNTLKRDLQRLLSLVENRACFILFEHDGQFLQDVFRIALENIKVQGEVIGKNVVIHSMSDITNSIKPTFQAQFFYEGGKQALGRIQRVMKTSNLNISKLSSFCLDQSDIQKIFSLKYCSLKVKLENRMLSLSPIIAQILSYEIIRSQSKKQNKKKFIFSFHQKITHQLVQYVINMKGGIYYKITHDEGRLGWSPRPRIQLLQQLDPQLQQILITINKYLDLNYILISAQCITDGIHGRYIRYSNDFFMAKQGQNVLTGINIDTENKKICTINQTLPYEVKVNQLKQWYEVMSYMDQLDTVDDLHQI